jgi:prepilin-type N-terminal cleavage/methylation domain-containing protein
VIRRGFNIIEIIIALVIAAVLATIVLPRAASFVDAIQVRGAVTEIESLFSTARHVAIARGAQSSLDIDPARGTISVRVGEEAVRTREVVAAHGVSLQATRTSITYAPTGMGYGVGNLSLIVTRGRVADTIFVSRLGRVRH